MAKRLHDALTLIQVGMVRRRISPRAINAITTLRRHIWTDRT